MRFETDVGYVDRRSKARYVWLKYGEILKGRLLDVGADECHLREHVPADVEYTGMDLAEKEDLLCVNLEQEPIPAADGAYDVVICLDVLEHLDNVHEVFGELCRVTSQWLILSLPNPWSAFFDYLVSQQHRSGGNLQHYGLPVERPSHWHKWFYAASQAKVFVEVFALKHGMEIVQLDSEGADPAAIRVPRSLAELAAVKNLILTRMLFRKGSYLKDLHEKTLWWVLRKKQ